MVNMDLQYEDDFGFVTALEQAIILGIPVNVKETFNRLNQITERNNVGMESYDFKKTALVISLEDVNVVKGAMVVAGVAALGVILKKIYDWIMGFFRSGGSGSSSGGTVKQEKIMNMLEHNHTLDAEIKKAMADYERRLATNAPAGAAVSKVLKFSQLPYALHSQMHVVTKYANMYHDAFIAYKALDQWIDRIELVVAHDKRHNQIHESEEMQKVEDKIDHVISLLDELSNFVPTSTDGMVDELAKQPVNAMTSAIRENYATLTGSGRLNKSQLMELREDIEVTTAVQKQLEGTTDPSEAKRVQLLRKHARVMSAMLGAVTKMGEIAVDVCEAAIRLCEHAQVNANGQKIDGVENFKKHAQSMKNILENK